MFDILFLDNPMLFSSVGKQQQTGKYDLHT